MTRDDIIRIAEENGIVIIGEAMFRFAALVEKHVEQRMLKAMELYGRTERENGAAQEREACARICDEHDNGRHANYAILCAAAIRERGTQ